MPSARQDAPRKKEAALNNPNVPNAGDPLRAVLILAGLDEAKREAVMAVLKEAGRRVVPPLVPPGPWPGPPLRPRFVAAGPASPWMARAALRTAAGAVSAFRGLFLPPWPTTGPAPAAFPGAVRPKSVPSVRVPWGRRRGRGGCSRGSARPWPGSPAALARCAWPGVPGPVRVSRGGMGRGP